MAGDFKNSSRRARSPAQSKISTLLVLSALVIPNDISVCPHCEVKSLKEAVGAVAPGGRITLKSGRYREIGIEINKTLSIIGEGSPVIDGDNQGNHLLVIKAPNVTIDGLTLRNTGSSYLNELAGIRVIESPGARILNNQFQNTTYGIYFEKSENGTVNGNRFEGTAKDEASAGNGIHLWTGSNFTIMNNEIHGQRDGIYFEFVKNTRVAGNIASGNLRYGLHFMSSHGTTYEDNTFTDNGAGVAVMYSHDIVMKRNKFHHNSGPAAYGLLLKELVTSHIEANTFSDNTVGLYLEGTNRSQFVDNQFLANGWALKIMGDCDNNSLRHNNFTANTFDVSTNSDSNPNTFSENYWSHYNGYDLDKDGFGDVPYRSVSLSSIILERVDSSFILLSSFLFTLLDEIERGLPELIPERMKDDRPLMEPFRRGAK